MYPNDPDGQYALMQLLLEERRAEAARDRLIQQLTTSRGGLRTAFGAFVCRVRRFAPEGQPIRLLTERGGTCPCGQAATYPDGQHAQPASKC